MKNKFLATTIFTAIMGATIAHAADKTEEKPEREKCYGVSKAGRNDCSAKDGSNSCAGYAKKDRDENVWVYVPIGLCDKLVGGVKG